MTTPLPRSAISTLFQTFLLLALAAPVLADAKPPAVGEEAKDFALPALSGNAVKLSTLTDTAPVVLVVLRGYPGYQCPYCTKQFGEFMAKADELKKTGATVVFIYPGPSDKLKEHADEFVNQKALPDHFRLLLDPDYSFTNAYGLRWDAKNETAHPATFVIDNKRQVVYAKVSKGHADRSNVADVVAAVGAIKK